MIYATVPLIIFGSFFIYQFSYDDTDSEWFI